MKETCNSCEKVTYIQNKKYNLCSDCVFKKSHGGKSRAEVYEERAKNKAAKSLNPITYTPSTYSIIGGDEEGLKNAIAQDIAEEREKEEQGYFCKLPSWKSEIRESKPKKKKGIKKISEKQTEINRLYKLTCIDMDYTTEPVCTGCLQYQGGDIKLSHSHIISREDCKRIGRLELIYERENLTYHCMDFGNNIGCHRKHESPIERSSLCDYKKNMDYIKSISEELYQKYLR